MLLDAEFIYRPRPPTGPSQVVFDVALESRLGALDPIEDAVLLIADSNQSAESLGPILARFPDLAVTSQIANPSLNLGASSDTPTQLGWPNPDRWQRFRQSDRWARIDAALVAGQTLPPKAYVVMPAHDAIWGRQLPETLVRFSRKHAKNGFPACVSPYSFYRHSVVPGAAISPAIINIVNVAFAHDPLFGWRLRFGRMQGFWGKTGFIPAGLCATIRREVDQTFLEDDSEIDRAIHKLGYAARALWIGRPGLYRQTLAVFTEADVRTLFERTITYSLPAGGSVLTAPPSAWMRFLATFNPRYARYWGRAERLIGEAQAAIQTRLDRFGASWFDWGAYRYVVRPGDPEAEVWRLSIS